MRKSSADRNNNQSNFVENNSTSLTVSASEGMCIDNNANPISRSQIQGAETNSRSSDDSIFPTSSVGIQQTGENEATQSPHDAYLSDYDGNDSGFSDNSQRESSEYFGSSQNSPLFFPGTPQQENGHQSFLKELEQPISPRHLDDMLNGVTVEDVEILCPSNHYNNNQCFVPQISVYNAIQPKPILSPLPSSYQSLFGTLQN